jgi:hypothetical protein
MSVKIGIVKNVGIAGFMLLFIVSLSCSSASNSSESGSECITLNPAKREIVSSCGRNRKNELIKTVLVNSIDSNTSKYKEYLYQFNFKEPTLKFSLLLDSLSKTAIQDYTRVILLTTHNHISYYISLKPGGWNSNRIFHFIRSEARY